MSVRKNVWADIQQRYVYTKTKTQSSKTKEAAPSAELLLLDSHLPTFQITLWAARDVGSVYVLYDITRNGARYHAQVIVKKYLRYLEK